MSTLRVNGADCELGDRSGSLLAFLRGELGLTGVKPGCGEGQCGACTVLVDGQSRLSCQAQLDELAGCSVTTIEGLAIDSQLHPVQQAFMEMAASQCGYCTPGMVLRGVSLLAGNGDPDDHQIATMMAPNLCRCGCYVRIVAAMHRAAELAADPRYTPLEIPPLVTMTTPAQPCRPWDLSPPQERDYFAVLGDGLVAVWPPQPGAPGMWSRGSGAWLHIAPTGLVTAFSGKVDVGQDNVTAFRLLVAEELVARLEDVGVVEGDTDLCPFDVGTFGSRSMPDAGEPLRRAAAGARELLCDLASSKWRCKASELIAEDGSIFTSSREECLAYGDLVTGLRRVVVIEREPKLLEGSTRFVGHRGHVASRLDVVTGGRKFVSDLDQPGMAHGALLRPPVRGATLRTVDLQRAANLPGVTVVQDGEFVGVVAENPVAARRAVGAIHAEWDLPVACPDDVSSYLRSHPIIGSGWERAVDEMSGDVEEGLSRAHIGFDATYSTAYIAHVPMETRAAIARWDGDRLTAWVGTQVPFGVRAQLADTLDIAEDKVRVIVPPTGGGFGGKHSGEVALEAARLSRAVNRPVKLHWSREEEFQFAYFRPMALIDVRVGLDEYGNIVAWDFLDVNAGSAGLSPPYRTRTRRLRYQPAASPLAQGSYRALAATANNFARESCIDELAEKIGDDPFEFRLAHLDDDRLKSVLCVAAKRFGWSSARPSLAHGKVGQGLAVGLEKGGRVATCIEVQVNDGLFDVTRIVTAYECGRVVNPDTVVNQIQGATVMALGGALFEEIVPDQGWLALLSLSSYRVPRFDDLPSIEVVLVDRPDLPSAGAGETPMIAVAPAIANAIYRVTGRRIRSLPMTHGDPTA